jgi:hypothetical protein
MAPNSSFVEKRQSNKCEICLDAIIDFIGVLKCGHMLHIGCYVWWCSGLGREACPVCGEDSPVFRPCNRCAAYICYSSAETMRRFIADIPTEDFVHGCSLHHVLQ